MRRPFEETQKFTQWWLWLILAVTAGGITATMTYGVYTQLVLGKPWGNEGIPDETLLILAILLVTAAVGGLIIYYTASLEIRIDEHTFSYRFLPVSPRWKTFDKDSIVSYRIVNKYLPGRFGIRLGLDGSDVYKVKGNNLLELKLTDNRTIHIGTQLPDQLLSALNNLKSRSTVD